MFFKKSPLPSRWSPRDRSRALENKEDNRALRANTRLSYGRVGAHSRNDCSTRGMGRGMSCTSPIRGSIRSVDQLDQHYKCSGCNLGKRPDTSRMVFASRTGRSDVARDRYLCIAV